MLLPGSTVAPFLTLLALSKLVAPLALAVGSSLIADVRLASLGPPGTSRSDLSREPCRWGWRLDTRGDQPPSHIELEQVAGLDLLGPSHNDAVETPYHGEAALYNLLR